MPTYPHKCKECEHEWEESYSINDNPPTKCPSCGAEGHVIRLIALSQGVHMKMSTSEFKESLATEKKKIKKQLKTDENLKANLMGEEAYHNTQTNIDSIQKDLDHKS